MSSKTRKLIKPAGSGEFFGATEHDLTGVRFELRIIKLVLFQGLINQKSRLIRSGTVKKSSYRYEN